MKIVAAMEDSNYFEKRAIELIHEAEADRITVLSCSMDKNQAGISKYKDAYHQKLNKAIQLIAMARVVEL